MKLVTLRTLRQLIREAYEDLYQQIKENLHRAQKLARRLQELLPFETQQEIKPDHVAVNVYLPVIEKDVAVAKLHYGGLSSNVCEIGYTGEDNRWQRIFIKFEDLEQQLQHHSLPKCLRLKSANLIAGGVPVKSNVDVDVDLTEGSESRPLHEHTATQEQIAAKLRDALPVKTWIRRAVADHLTIFAQAASGYMDQPVAFDDWEVAAVYEDRTYFGGVDWAGSPPDPDDMLVSISNTRLLWLLDAGRLPEHLETMMRFLIENDIAVLRDDLRTDVDLTESCSG